MENRSAHVFSHTNVLVPPLPSAVTFSSWVFVDAARPDLQRQCLGLVKALGMDPQISKLQLRPLVSFVPRQFWGRWSFRPVEEGFFSPPWPDFVLGSGPLGAVATSLVKRLSKQKTFAVSLGHPKLPLNAFDCVVGTMDDPLSGPNVIPTSGALSCLTEKILQQAAHSWQRLLRHLPHPWISVFIGDSPTGTYPDKLFIEKFTNDLIQLSRKTGGGLMVLCPQQSPVSLTAELEKALKPYPHVLWKGEGDSPYEAFLGAADYLIVTADSSPLLSDALATDKPLYIYPPFSGPLRNQPFAQHFFKLGLARPFEKTLDFWARPAFSEAQFVAAELLKRFINRA